MTNIQTFASELFCAEKGKVIVVMVADTLKNNVKSWWGSRRTILLYTSLSLHVVWLFLFFMIIWMGPYVRILPSPEWLGWCVGCARAIDSIAAASEIGRLDVISLLLAFLGLIIGLFAFFVYINVKSSAVDAAKEKTEEWLAQNYEKLLPKDYVKVLTTDERLILTLVNQIRSRISEEGNTTSANDADNIAKSMGEPK